MKITLRHEMVRLVAIWLLAFVAFAQVEQTVLMLCSVFLLVAMSLRLFQSKS
jgi:hypothetical protein